MKIKELTEGTIADIAKGALKGIAKGATSIVAPGAVDKFATFKQEYMPKTSGATATAPAATGDEPAATSASAERKTLSSFARILPKHVSVTRRDPLVIKYGTQDFAYDAATKKWKDVKGKPVQDATLNQLLSSWADEIETYDPTPQAPIVNIAQVKTTDGLAIKTNKGTWFLNKRAVTDPGIISALNQAARDSGQLK